MLISCSICKDIFSPNSEVCGTKCGHLYHESCLKRWQVRSLSCPQCRTRLTDKPYRIYFVIEDSPDCEAELDATVLKEKLGIIQEDLAVTKRKTEQLELSYAKVKEELVANTKKVTSAELTIKALKQRVKELQKENEALAPLLVANRALKLKLESMTDLHNILQGTEREVHEMINKTPVTPLAVHQLCVYVGALKKQLKVTEEKFKNEKESLLLSYRAIKQKMKDLLIEKHSKETQTCRKERKIDTNTCMISKPSLKRPLADSSQTLSEFENIPQCSSSNLECQPPAAKKQSLVHKKIINNLDKSVKTEIPSDSSDIELIYSGPSKNKVLKSAVAWESTSIFNKFKPIEKVTVDNKTGVAFNTYGRSTRNVFAVSSSSKKMCLSKFSKKL